MAAVQPLGPKPLDDEARLKLALMAAIDEHLRARFRTLEEAADYVDVGWTRLSRIRSRLHEQFSIGWLFNLAKAGGVRVRITIETLN